MQTQEFEAIRFHSNNTRHSSRKQDLLEYSITDSEKPEGYIYDSQRYMISSGQKSDLDSAKKFSILTFNNNVLENSNHPGSESSLISFNANIKRKSKEYVFVQQEPSINFCSKINIDLNIPALKKVQ